MRERREKPIKGDTVDIILSVCDSHRERAKPEHDRLSIETIFEVQKTFFLRKESQLDEYWFHPEKYSRFVDNETCTV